jgi:hypothetical protein
LLSQHFLFRLTLCYFLGSFLVFFDFSLPSDSILLDCLRGKLSSLLCVVMKAFLKFLGQFSEKLLKFPT